jgi:hypothetical protein
MSVLRSLVALSLCTMLGAAELAPLPAIPRRLPAAGKPVPDADRARLDNEVKELGRRIAAAGDNPLLADVRVLHKAVDFALRFGEFYDVAKDVAKADWALKLANERLGQLAAKPWTTQHGSVVRGFVSAIDGSVQPYGLVIPDQLDLAKPAPLYVWLHGRGENSTDLHFLSGCANGKGEIHPDDTIMLHAFGRQCVGFKNAGEIDILEAIAHAQANYRIDPDRIVLMGFSMGGGGSKQTGAHYADHWAVLETGAGFAETARFCRIPADKMPPWYEQTLWGQYDVPGYVRNLFNIPVVAYSGEKDGQIQAARVLEEAYKEHGKVLTHLIGPDTQHKHHPETLKQVLALVKEAVVKGRDPNPAAVMLQTRTLRYSSMYWVQALGLEEHWKDSRVDATAGDQGIAVTTKNLTALRLTWPQLKAGSKVTIDGQALTLAAEPAKGATLVKNEGKWKQGEPAAGLRKSPGLQGPIDDAFMAPFLVVVPSGKCRSDRVQRWVDAERLHAIDRWAAVMRADVRLKADKDVTPADIRDYHLVLWGDSAANSVLARLADKLPIAWDAKSITVGDKTYDASAFVPTLIYPNPLNPTRYVVLNSGLTCRETADNNNAQQNPKLPDWAVIDLAQDPDTNGPGGIADAGFFDEGWKLKKRVEAAK